MIRSRRWLGLLVPTLLGACAQPAVQMGDTAADEAAINAVRDREVTLAALGNPDSIVTLYTEDVVIMPAGEPAVEGREAARQWAVNTFNQVSLGVNYTSSQVTVAGDWAIDRFAGVLTITPKAGGPAMTEEVKGIHVMRRDAEGWKIAVDVWNMNAPPAPAPAPGAARP